MEVILRNAIDKLGHPGDVVTVSAGYARNYLVPRGLAMLGLVGGALIVLSGTAVIFGVTEAGSAAQVLAAMPEFVWELSFGIYLIVKGFRTPAADVQGATSQPAVTR